MDTLFDHHSQLLADSGIYVIVNTANNKKYIGSSKNIRARAYVHVSCLRKGKHRNQHLQRAWANYGEGAFKFGIIELTEELLIREDYWINNIGAFNDTIGYNISSVMLESKNVSKQRKRNSEKACRRLIGLIEKYGKNLPSIKGSYGQENTDAQWVQRQRCLRFKKNGFYSWHPELLEIANKYGVVHWFELRDDLSKVLARFAEINDKFLSKGIIPRQHANDVVERRAAGWINNRRNIKAGKSADQTWRPELDDAANKYGFPKFFDHNWKVENKYE